MKPKKLFLIRLGFISMLTFTCMSAIAQKTITGVVTDVGLQTLPGVNIVVKGSSNGVSTNSDGAFSISKIASKDVLVFSYLGFKTLEVTVGNQTSINIMMKSDAQQLEDIVVIGYGSANKKDLTASVTSVSSKDFDKQPLSRAEDALLGRAAGVQVIKNSGAPGADIKVRVRGLNSINGNNDPLVVVDGIIGGNLSSINTNDIKTFDILKDASATAIYGSRGANGVILITTKQGQVGPAKIDVNYFTSVSTVPRKLDLITPQQFADIVNKGISNPANYVSVSGTGVDYQDIYFQSAVSNNLQLSASGKTGKTSFFISGNYVGQEGIVFNSDYNRISLRSNLKTDLTDKLSIGLNIFGSREKAFNLINGGTASDERGGISSIITFNPTLPLRDADGNFTKSSVYGSLLVNPYAVRHERFGDAIENRFNANLNLSYDIRKNLNFTVLAGGSLTNGSSEVYQGIPDGTNDQQAPTSSFSSKNFSSYQLSNIINYSKDFDKSSLKVTGVYEIQELENRYNGFSAANYSIGGIRDGYYFAELAASQAVSADYNASTLQSYLGRAQYDYDSRLYITAAIRLDETSRFRKGNRTGVFPSGSVAYKVTPNSNTKVRVGYGETGNQDISPYSTYQRFITGVNAPINGSSLITGIALGVPVDENLTWETTKQINFGVDFGLLKGRINTSIDLYQKNTTDLLVKLPQPLSLGGGSLLTNAGKIKNTGIDVSIRSAIIDTDNFKWDANFNFSYVKNEVVDISGLPNIFQSINVGTNTNAFIIEKGQPIGNFYGPTFLGTWKTGEDPNQVAGSAKYALDKNGQVSQSVIGNGVPTTTWGLSQTFTYKNFDLNVLLRGVHDFDVLNVTRSTTLSTSIPTAVEYLNRWTPQNQTEIPASGNVLFNSSRFVEDGSFIRLSNVTLGYNMPSTKTVFNSVRLYVSAQNLFTITDYSGYDPEVSATSGSDSGNVDTRSSVDWGAYPNPRTFTFGVNLGF